MDFLNVVVLEDSQSVVCLPPLNLTSGKVRVTGPLQGLGYDRRALAVQTLLTWIVLPVTYLVTDPAANINWVFGFGKESQTVIHPLLYLSLGMTLLPVVIYLPGHLVLQRLFSHR